MEFDFGIFLVFSGALIIIFLFGKALLIPFKVIGKLLLNSVIGAAVMLLFNLLGSSIGFFIPINVVNSFIVGLLGLPGFIMLLVLTNC